MTTTDNGTALATRELSDKQIQTRIDLNRKAGYGLEKANPATLNLIFLYCQKYQLLPGDDVTLYENKPWLTLLGTVKLMRRHDEYRGFECHPLTVADKEAWGYDPADIVVECQIRTASWGTISARGKVSKEEIAGLRVEGRRLNYVASIHPVEMAEKRAIQRAERLAFGADAMIDEDEIEEVARTVIEERNDPQRVAANAAEYDRVFGAEYQDDGTGAEEGTVPMVTSTSSPEWKRWQAVIKQAHAAKLEVPAVDLPLSVEALNASIASLREAVAAAVGSEALPL